MCSDDGKSTPRDVTRLLLRWAAGEEEALDDLMPVVYRELYVRADRVMRRERGEHTLQATALVNETFLGLLDQNRVNWQNRAQFFGVAAQMMRRIVLKHARRYRAQKHGGGLKRVPLEEVVPAVWNRSEELLLLDEALRRLEALDARQARIVELRYFGGLSVEEAAECLSVSKATVKRETRSAHAWLRRELDRCTQRGAVS